MSYVDWFNSIQGTGLSIAEKNRQAAEQAAQKQASLQPVAKQGDFWSDTGDNAMKALDAAMKWDVGGWRPVEHTLNAIGSLGTGMMNMLEGGEQGRQGKQYTFDERTRMHFDYGQNKWVQNQEWENGFIPTAGRFLRDLYLKPFADFATGTGAAITNNTSDVNYRTGSDVIETYTDYANRENNPTGYVDTKDNADPTAKFWGGLAMDIAIDPLWAVPGGAVAAGVRGLVKGGATALKGIKAAEGVADTAKAVAKAPLTTAAGTVVGAGADAGYKLGRFTNRTKPVGLKQYVKVEDYKAFEKLGRRSNVSSQDLLKLAKNEISPAELSAKLTATAAEGAAKKGTKSVAKTNSKYSVEALAKLGQRAQRYAGNAEEVIDGVWRGANGQVFRRADAAAKVADEVLSPEEAMGREDAMGEAFLEQQAREAARDAQLEGFGPDVNFAPIRPETQMNAGVFTETKMTQGGTTAPASQTSERVVDRVDIPGVVRPAPFDDGVLPTSVAEHNTISLPDHEVFEIRPGMTMAEAKVNARRLLYAAAPNSPTANPEIFRDLLERYDRVFNPPAIRGGKTEPQAPFGPQQPKALPAGKRNPTVYTSPLSDALEATMRTSDEAEHLKALKDENSVEFADDFETAIAQRAQIMDEVISAIGGPDKLAEFRATLNLSGDEKVSEFIFGMNRFIDDMKQGDFDSVFQAIQLIAKLPFEIPGYTERARKLVQSVMDADSIETEARLINDMAKEYRDSLFKVGADLPEDAALLGLEGARAKITNYAKDGEYDDTFGGLDEVISPDDVKPQAVAQGDYVNVFGKIIEFPEWELKAVIDETIETALKKANSEEVNLKGLSAEEFEALARHTPTANTTGYSRGDALPHRSPAKIKNTANPAAKVVSDPELDKILADPKVPAYLDTVYDHVVGFAREPLGLEDWVRTVFAISRSTAAVANRAAALIKKLEMDTVYDLKPIVDFYRDTYLKSFQLAEKATKGVRKGSEWEVVPDRTAGVDFEGNLFVDNDKYISKEMGAGQKKIEALRKTQKEAESVDAGATGAEKFYTHAKVRETQGRAKDATISLEADRTRKKLEKAFKKTDPKTGDPIHARHTDGDWLDGETLTKTFLQGSVAAFSLNLVEHAKLTGGNGLRRALESLAPKVTWSDRKFSKEAAEKPVTKATFDTPEQVSEAVKAFKDHEPTFQNALQSVIAEKVAKADKKKSPAAILEAAKAELSRGSRKAPESTGAGNKPSAGTGFGKDDPYAGYSTTAPGDFVEGTSQLTPWRNMVEIDSALQDIAARAGVPEAKTEIWEAIVSGLKVVPDKESVWKIATTEEKTVIEKLTQARSVTGYKPAVEVEIKDSTTAKTLKRSSANVAEINKGLEIDTKELVTVTEMLSGKKVESFAEVPNRLPEANVGALIDLVNGVTVKVSEKGKVTVLTADALRELPPAVLSQLEQALKGGIRDAKDVGRMSSGNTLADFYRSKSPDIDGAMTASRAARVRLAEAINSVNLWNGDTIREFAKTLDARKILATNTKDLAAVWGRITKPSHKTALNHAASAGYRAHIAGAKGKVFRQEGAQEAWNAISKVIDDSGLFPAGSVESWNAKLLAMRKTRLILGQSGIYDVTAGGKWGGRMHSQNGLDPDYAYIGSMDVIDGLEKVLPGDATRVIFDTLKIGGQSMPISLVQEASLLAMKMAAEGMDITGRVASIENVLLALIQKTPKLRAYYADAVANADGPARASVAMIANALSDNRVMTMMMDRHKRRGAMAVVTAEKNSVQVAGPFMERLTKVAQNMYITTGEVSGQLDAAINDLRSALSAAGFAKGSLEHAISSKMLENRSLDLFSPMEHNTARLQTRMKAVIALPAGERAAALNGERAAAFRSIEETVNEAAEESVIRSIGDAGADPIALENALDEAEHIVDSAVSGSSRIIDHMIRGVALFRKAPDERAAGLHHAILADSMRQMESAFESEIGRVAPDPARRAEILVDPNYGGSEVLKSLDEQMALQKIEVDKAWDHFNNMYLARTEPQAASAAPAVANTLQPAAMQVDEAGEVVAKTDDSGILPDAVSLGDMTSTGVGHKIRSTFSGRAGAEDLNPIVGTERMILESAGNTTMKNIERAAKAAAKINATDGEVIHMLTSLISMNPAGRPSFIENLKNGDFKEFAEAFFKGVDGLLDGSAITRAGLSTDHVNKYLLPGKQGGPLSPGLHGAEAEIDFQKFVTKMLRSTLSSEERSFVAKMMGDASKDPKHDWVSVLKWLNDGMTKAALMPTIGADFSAKFGHLAQRSETGIMTAAEAKANGWVRILKSGNDELSQFIDADQYYPADMVRQLANTQKLLNAVMSTSGHRWVRAMDKTHNFIKASLTLWVPANHLVNIQGEFMSNLMAGVWSPTAYVKAYRALKDSGYLKNVVKHNYEQGNETFFGNVGKTFDNAEVGSAIKLRVGNNRSMSFKDFMTFLNQNGLIIMNNTVEDLIVEGGKSVNKSSKLSRLTSPIWKTNQAIGQFAARRDNLFRIAHAIHIAEQQSFRNMDELADFLRREVSAYHPTMHHLSAFEQKYARRVLFFYTWQRGMLSKVMEALIERPQFVAMPAKANYAISGAMGGDPQSFGQPAPNDPRIPGWAAGQVTGPMYYNSAGEVVSFSLNAPGLDILQKYFGGIQANRNLSPGENLANSFKNVLQDDVTDQFSPTAATSFELLKAIDSTPGMYQGPDWPQFLTDMTGFGKISRMTGMTLANKYGVGPVNSTGTPMPIRSDMNTQQEMDYTRFKSFVNYITPLRFNFPSQYEKSAERERSAYNKKITKYQDTNNPDFWDQLWGRISGLQK